MVPLVLVYCSIFAFEYFWMANDPSRIYRHLWILGLFPVLTPVVQVWVAIVWGHPCAHNGWTALSANKIALSRAAYFEANKGE
ncbi:hypothetical protein K227x_45290 [Rubripirellula lacrimiformis]|uniref:Uncharacterized protein n=2 Tax=Rubripirellula lacrimiformis TaxID=1930273 RepID=A0A517NG65_9BACT|nr:hypothetical protein K227x_45290 [Rubripirellula lacrimiformis]